MIESLSRITTPETMPNMVYTEFHSVNEYAIPSTMIIQCQKLVATILSM